MVGPEEALKTQEYKAYRWRWLVLFAFCTFTFSNALGFVQYSPILSLAAEYYGVTDQDIVWFSNCYYITYVVFCPFTIRPLEKRLDLSLFLAAFVTTLGQWFIYIAQQTYSFALVGFILIGMGQIFILAAPAYISDRWFPMHERTVSTSLGSFFNLVGLNFSIVYASITFQNVTDHNEIVDQIDFMNLLFAIFTSLAFIFCVTMIRNKPATPPSISAASEKMLILPSFKRAFRSFESIMDLLTFSMFIGVSWAYMVVIAILLAPFNYTTEQIGYVSIVYAATGAVGGTLASIYVDYQIKNNSKPHYDYLIKGFLTIGVAGILIKALIINYVNDTVIVVLSGIIGFGLNSFLPLALQCYIEKLFPSFELVLTTAIMQMSNLFGFILNYILILEVFLDVGLWVILVAMGPFYLYLIFGYKTKFLRLEMEQQAAAA
ncbi:unnamed protein product [Paramecium octaurelia]|uniref:Major facilitator superfamily (MFS) profile domain-containing protein n=1 Tax=Paramecium octaurelia TaxID=43137 RepID=A0A8S1RZK1_PAROT|nr:unnamed protein product [Paramecium octaurelia]